ncbi:MAG TPA: hypothetical protein ENK23_01790, partial [Sorangium sp.]|nr:hypothetical protein [Sorangium sp.]
MALDDHAAHRLATERLRVLSEHDVLTRNESVHRNLPLKVLLAIVAYPGGLAALALLILGTIKLGYERWLVPVSVVGSLLWIALWMLPQLATRRTQQEVWRVAPLLSVRPAVDVHPPAGAEVVGTIVDVDAAGAVVA